MLVCFCLFWCCYPTVLWMISQYDYVTWKYHSSEPALPSPPNPSMPVDFLPPSSEMQYSDVLRATPALGVAPGARMEPRGKWFSLVKKNECESHAVLWQWNDTYIHRKCDWVKFLLKFRKWNSFAINVRNINPLTFRAEFLHVLIVARSNGRCLHGDIIVPAYKWVNWGSKLALMLCHKSYCYMSTSYSGVIDCFSFLHHILFVTEEDITTNCSITKRSLWQENIVCLYSYFC